MAKQPKELPPLPAATRSKVARDMLVFQVKLFVDGFKDVLMSPLSLAAGLLGIVFGGGSPGKPLYEVMRLGKRVESWINLFSAAQPPTADDHEGVMHESGEEPEETEDKPRRKPQKAESLSLSATQTQSPAEDAGPELYTPRDFDALVDQLQATLLDPEARSRLSETSKNQLNQVTRKLLKDYPSNHK